MCRDNAVRGLKENQNYYAIGVYIYGQASPPLSESQNSGTEGGDPNPWSSIIQSSFCCKSPNPGFVSSEGFVSTESGIYSASPNSAVSFLSKVLSPPDLGVFEHRRSILAHIPSLTASE